MFFAQNSIFVIYAYTENFWKHSDNRKILEEFKIDGIDENLYSSLSEVKKSRDIIPKKKTKLN